jgi:hypothetical protein
VVAVAALTALLIVGCTHSKRPQDNGHAPRSTPSLQQAIPSQYVKEWGRHGGVLTINANGTGEMSYRTDHEKPAGDFDVYYEHVTMRFRVSPDGRSLVGTVTADQVTDSFDSSGRPVPVDGYVNVGDEFVYSLKSTGALNEHPTRPPQPAEDDIAWCTSAALDPACGP